MAAMEAYLNYIMYIHTRYELAIITFRVIVLLYEVTEHDGDFTVLVFSITVNFYYRRSLNVISYEN